MLNFPKLIKELLEHRGLEMGTFLEKDLESVRKPQRICQNTRDQQEEELISRFVAMDLLGDLSSINSLKYLLHQHEGAM